MFGMLKVFSSGKNDVDHSFVDICTVCAVASKIVNFDLETSDGSDLDQAFLDALTHTMRAEFHEDAVQSIEYFKNHQKKAVHDALHEEETWRSGKDYLNLGVSGSLAAPVYQ
jgi:hypothetical protein